MNHDCQTSLSSYDSVTKTEMIKIFIRLKPSENKNLCVMPYIMKMDDTTLRMDGKTLKYDHVFAGDALQ